MAAIGLVISWIPDLALYAVGTPDTTVVGVLSLMSLHVVAAGLAVFRLGRYGLRPSTGKEQFMSPTEEVITTRRLTKRYVLAVANLDLSVRRGEGGVDQLPEPHAERGSRHSAGGR